MNMYVILRRSGWATSALTPEAMATRRLRQRSSNKTTAPAERSLSIAMRETSLRN